jgi:hypothetical protein
VSGFGHTPVMRRKTFFRKYSVSRRSLRELLRPRLLNMFCHFFLPRHDVGLIKYELSSRTSSHPTSGNSHRTDPVRRSAWDKRQAPATFPR